jgi:tripartite-type tricarboxylate transporter receptor subunit TctC
VGTFYVKQAPPDGYTILQAWLAPMVIVPLFQADPGYSPLKDFFPITQVSAEPVVILARKDRPWNTIAEFIRDAKSNPGKLVWSGGGALSIHSLLCLSLMRNEGVDVSGVYYEGATAALPDLLGGSVHISCGTTTFLALQPDRVKAIGIFAEKRDPTLPDVPTVKELGLRAPAIRSWSGLAVRSDTSLEIRARLVEVFRAALTSKEFHRQLYEAARIRVQYAGPEAFRKVWEASFEELKPLVGAIKR